MSASNKGERLCVSLAAIDEPMESELEAALRAVREIEESIGEQRQLVADMERASLSHAAAIASAKLEALESTLASHLERLKRVGGLHC